MATGVSPLDPVWRQAVREEQAAGSGQHCLTLLWYLLKRYEHVAHGGLAGAAVAAARTSLAVPASSAARA